MRPGVEVEPGYCQCGCGEFVGFWRWDDRGPNGHKAGDPKKYVQYHDRKNLDTYEVRECRECGKGFRIGKVSPVQCCSSRCSNSLRSRALAGKSNPRFNGGLTFHRDRWRIYCRDHSFVAFARAVVAAELRRPLTSDEIVHHINGDSTDDRIENLVILTRAEHLALHRPEFEEKRKRAAVEGRRNRRVLAESEGVK